MTTLGLKSFAIEISIFEVFIMDGRDREGGAVFYFYVSANQEDSSMFVQLHGFILCRDSSQSTCFSGCPSHSKFMNIYPKGKEYRPVRHERPPSFSHVLLKLYSFVFRAKVFINFFSSLFLMKKRDPRFQPCESSIFMAGMSFISQRIIPSAKLFLSEKWKK